MTPRRADWPSLCRDIRAAVDAAGFEVDDDPAVIHMDTMLLASPPKSVRDAVGDHRRGLNADPAGYISSKKGKDGFPRAKYEYLRVADAAARYLGLERELKKGMLGVDFIAQHTSTTTGLALLANGIKAKPGREVLISEHDFFSWRNAWKLRCRKTSLLYREIKLYDDIAAADLEDRIVDEVVRNISPATRVVALTWVHSSTGLKMPIARIGEQIARMNHDRAPDDQILFCVDGVHGFGIEDTPFPDLNCHFFVTGCHKWLFGPRGTGITCARPESWDQVEPTIPTFVGESHPGLKHTPGGVACYEHAWAVAEAFQLHERIGQDKIAAYTHELATILKEGLTELGKARGNVCLITPMKTSMSSGVVCCDVHGMDPAAVVERLRDVGILAMVSSPDAGGEEHVRFSPSILNTEGQIRTVLEAMARIFG